MNIVEKLEEYRALRTEIEDIVLAAFSAMQKDGSIYSPSYYFHSFDIGASMITITGEYSHCGSCGSEYDSVDIPISIIDNPTEIVKYFKDKAAIEKQEREAKAAAEKEKQAELQRKNELKILADLKAKYEK